MPDWNFKTIEETQTGIEFVELTYEQVERILLYREALRTASKSDVANPRFSNYFVKAAIGTPSLPMIPAGNIEYGHCQALHGEESAVAAFRSRYGRKTDKPVIIGLIAGAEGNIATPCGNCRDILADDLGRNVEIVSGAASGGLAIVARLEDYLFEPIRPGELKFHAPGTIERGKRLTSDFYSPDVRPERRYVASISTSKGAFIGCRDLMCEYHPIYPLEDAVRAATRENDFNLNRAIITCEDQTPHVMYRDRQHLLEFNLYGELLEGKERDPPVYLVTTINGQISRVLQTSVKEWLPLPFSPRNFGPEFVRKLEEALRAKQ